VAGSRGEPLFFNYARDMLEVDANRYSVVIIWQGSEAHVLEVSYKVALDGTLEDYDVRSMDDSDR